MEFSVQELQKKIQPTVTILLSLRGWDVKHLPLGRSVTHAIDRCPDCGDATEHGDWVEFKRNQDDVRDITYRAHVPVWIWLKIFFISILPWYRSVYNLKKQRTYDNAGFSFKLTAQFAIVELKDCSVVNVKGIWKMLPKTA